MSIISSLFSRSPRSFRRYVMVGVVVVSVITVSGWLINHFLILNNSKTQIVGTGQGNSVIDQHFSAALGYMQIRQYEKAIDEWHKIMLINPGIPEVLVNMGFSLYELGQYETAHDFFNSAIEQNTYQANAYYGLAIVSEKKGDLESAIGAMRSYIHLAGDNEKFIRKARAALWEWESQLASVKDQQSPEHAEITEKP